MQTTGPLPRPPCLPDDAVLVHIGPNKTGTTTIQTALQEARGRLGAYGVYTLAHPQHTASLAARWVCDCAPRPGAPDPTERDWRRVVERAGRHPDERLVISSEFFAKGRKAAVERVVRELGDQRVHVAITLRPLSKILPSMWQQAVQNGLRIPYEQWLDATLRAERTRITPRFWAAHDHARLIRQWSAATGPGRVSVIVVDETNPRMLLDAFEELLGLAEGTLSYRRDLANRSLTAPEAELIRRLNEACAEAEVDEKLRGRLVRDGAAPRLKAAYVPAPGDPRVATPEWALESAAERDRATVDAIRRHEVRVIGDLSVLLRRPARFEEPDVGRVATDAAVQAAFGVVLMAQSMRAVRGNDRPLRQVTSRELIKVVLQRAVRRMRGGRRPAGTGPRQTATRAASP